MANDKPQYSGWSGLLKHLLDFISTPWRAIFLLIAGIVVAVGYLIWEERAFLREYITSRPATVPALRSNVELEGAINDIFTASASTGISAIGIWSVSLGANRADFRVGRRQDGSEWRIYPSVIPWVEPETSATKVYKLMSGQASCANPSTLTGGWYEPLVADGMMYVCFVPEPPSNIERRRGLVLVAWKDQPSDTRVYSALAAVMSHTDKILTMP